MKRIPETPSSSPRVDEPTLAQLIEWSRGYLERKRTVPLPIPSSEIRDHNISIDLWTGMLLALTELSERRAAETKAPQPELPKCAHGATEEEVCPECLGVDDAEFGMSEHRSGVKTS